MRFLCLFLVLLIIPSCSNSKKSADTIAADENKSDAGQAESGISIAMRNAELPDALIAKLAISAQTSVFTADFSACLATDPHLRELVDKQHPLPHGYNPPDLVTLEGGSYLVNRAGLQLRKTAADSLEKMAAAARRDGVTLVASSAYRSYDYQEQVYNRIVREMGQEAADRESARPGHSQHQTGLVLDFGSIDDSFARTAASDWLIDNAATFGWSISFPNGYEAVTGYRWESWHYRYVGGELTTFINRYFDGIQQYALRFLYEYEQLP